MKAKVIYKSGAVTPNGREGIYELRKGEKGTGALIQKVTYWPWSSKSCEVAQSAIQWHIDRNNVEGNPWE